MSWWFQPLAGAPLLLGGAGAQTLTPTVVTDGDSFGAATVTTGAVTLTATLLSDADSFGAATVDQGGATGVLNLLTEGASTTGTDDVVTASTTVTGGRPVIVVFMDSGNDPTSGTAHTISGAGQTWTEIYGAPVAGDDIAYTRMSIWTSPASSGGSGALTIGTEPISTYAYSVVEFEPSSGATATLGAEVEATTAENTTTNSVALSAADYWIAMVGASKASAYGSLTATPRAGWAETSEQVAIDSGWLVAVEVQISPLDGDTDASVTWSENVNIPLIAVPVTLTGGGGGQTLTATLYSDGDSFGAASITAGAVTLTGTIYTDADAFGAATISTGAVTLTATAYSDPDTFGAATIATGAVTFVYTDLEDVM